ncbi:MAG: hypothetical protein JNG88_07155 [Phycisphaerales bacterium]|nr:hypothetical protein [Phycisphaerales bacterium]
MRYSFTESGNCRTDLWIKQLNAPLGEMVYELTFDVKEKSGGAVTGAEVFVFDDVNRNGEIDTSDRAILEYHLPDGPPSSAVRCGPLKAQWRAQDVAFPYLLVTYEVNHSTTGRNLSALYDVANAPLPSSMPASARSSDQPGD